MPKRTWKDRVAISSPEKVELSSAPVNESLDLGQIVQTLCQQTQPAFQADQVEVWLSNGSPNGVLQTAAAADGAADELDRRAAALAQYLKLDHARLLLAAPVGAPASPTQPDLLGLARSLILAPLSRDRDALGALVIAEWRREQPFAADRGPHGAHG